MHKNTNPRTSLNLKFISKYSWPHENKPRFANFYATLQWEVKLGKFSSQTFLLSCRSETWTCIEQGDGAVFDGKLNRDSFLQYLIYADVSIVLSWDSFFYSFFIRIIYVQFAELFT